MQTNPPERYTVLGELGRGAIGAVYAARDSASGAIVALKTLDPALFREPNAELAESFLNNAHSAARLRHRNIVRVLDSGEAGGTAYVAMELVEGESLRKMLEEQRLSAGPLPIARAIQIFDDIASALAYAHEERTVHRGVRPSNILVSASGVAKLTDFGIGQIGDAARRYMSPEQERREPLDHRSDLFSLGVVLYEMLTGQIPQADPPPPSKVNPHVPGALDALVSRLLAPRPDDRFANARDLLRELQRLEDALGLRPAVSVSPAEPVLRIPDQSAAFMEDRGPRLEPPSGSPAASVLAALAIVLAMLSIGLTVVLHYSPDLIERFGVAIPTQEAPRPPPEVAASAPPPAPAAEPVKEAEPSPVAAAPEPVPPVPLVAEPAPSESAAGATAARPAKLLIAVSPRGELYVNGEHQGTTPPLTTLDLEPGMHRIEIRNGSRTPYLTYVTIKAGEERRIRHDFNAKPGRPPR